MNNKAPKGIPKNILNIIRVHIRTMIKNGYFNQQDFEDLEQELILFYLEKLCNLKTTPPSEGFLFISFKNRSLDLFRAKKRQQGRIVSEDDVVLDDILNTQMPERQIDMEMFVQRLFGDLNKQEKDICLMIMGGATFDEISKEQHISTKTIYKILGKIKNFSKSGKDFFGSDVFTQ